MEMTLLLDYKWQKAYQNYRIYKLARDLLATDQLLQGYFPVTVALL